MYHILLLCYYLDRPWLTDVQKIKKMQEKVYLALQRCLQKEGAPEEKLAKVQWHDLSHKLTWSFVTQFFYLIHNVFIFYLFCMSTLDGVKASCDEVSLQPSRWQTGVLSSGASWDSIYVPSSL